MNLYDGVTISELLEGYGIYKQLLDNNILKTDKENKVIMIDGNESINYLERQNLILLKDNREYEEKLLKMQKENQEYKRLGFKHLNDKNIELSNKLVRIEKIITAPIMNNVSISWYSKNILDIIKGEQHDN